MSRRLPPLNAVRAFEAAARNLSFTLAAQELNVTQGAISRHVATLEGWLQAKLFTRSGRGIVMTAQGLAYFRAVTSVLDQLDYATQQIRGHPDTGRLRLKLPPTFAIRWLMPRLARFHALHRKIDVQVTTSYEPADFSRDDIDISIYSAPGPVTGLSHRRLFAEYLTPVCSPGFLEQAHIVTPRDVGDLTLLSSVNRPLDWQIWLEAANVGTIDGNAGLRFENSALALQAALQGIGMTIAQPALVEDDMETHRLLAPFPLRVPTGNVYYLSFSETQRDQPRIRAFQEWIADEVAMMSPHLF